MRTCTKCAETKPVDDFYRDRGRLRSDCKDCTKAGNKASRCKRGAWANKDARYLREYGITYRKVVLMWLDQDGKCASCGDSLPRAQIQLDHDHITGAARAVLCGPCNSALGHAKEEPQRLIAIADYIVRFQAAEARKVTQ